MSPEAQILQFKWH